jgi:protease-4
MAKRGRKAKSKEGSPVLKNILTIIGIISGGLSLLLFLFIFFSIFASLSSPTTFETGNVAVIPIKGIILSENGGGVFASESLSSAQIINWIEEAEEDPLIEAIVFEINSPGGTPVASEQIARAIKETEKPTVAVIQDIGASGAYWVASSTDIIFANQLSLVGSIGVIASYVELAGTLERYNATYKSLKAGEFKDTGSPLKELTNREEQLLQNQLDKIHDIFIKEVAQNRGLPEDKIRTIANGWVYLGVDSQQIGLVDRLGNKQDAYDYLEEKYSIQVEPVEFSSIPSFFEKAFGVFNGASYSIGQGIGDSIKEGSVNKPVQVWT